MKRDLKSWFTSILMLLGLSGCFRSIPADRPTLSDSAFDKKLNRLLWYNAPLMGVDELAAVKEKVHIFDARKREEFDTSHIPGARFYGFPELNVDALIGIPRQDTIVMYCSVGYRSEKAARQLMGLGYEHVFNLYGSIFEWVNKGYEVVDKEGKPTRKLHTYNANWSQWVRAPGIERVW